MWRLVILSCVLGFLSLGIPSNLLAQEGTVEVRQWATSATASSQYSADSWSAMQAMGAPNTPACGDYGTAWASASSTEVATLTLRYTIPIRPSQVNIYQTYNPGAIVRIELLRSDGGGIAYLQNSSDPGDLPCPGVLTIDIPEDVPLVDGVILYLDQTLTGGWNQIDAVELVGQMRLGSKMSMWADYAEASTQRDNNAYSASQVIGAPDSEGCADAQTAWASALADGIDQLIVFFPYTVIPSQLDIYQNYNPGAIARVDLIASDGSLVAVTNSADAGTPCPGKMSLNIQTEAIVIGAIIHLDQSLTGDWNQIDAVQMTGLLADDGLLRQWATTASATSQYTDDRWSAMQATGAPDTRGCGDYGTAWASASSIGKDALTVLFERAVIPTSIYIYQSYNPGAIVRIELLPADGSAPISVTGAQGTTVIPCPGFLVVDILETAPPINGVTIHLDQTLTGNWNEIDAVRLIGKPADNQ